MEDVGNQIQQMKEEVGQYAEQVISSGMGLVKKGSKYHCPNTMEHKNGDKNPSMAWDREALQFYCFTCGEKIDIYQYYRECENKSHKEILGQYISNKPFQGVKNLPEKHNFTIDPLKEINKKYLHSRGINEDIATIFKLGSTNNNLAIPYFEDKSIKGVKVRNPKGKIPKYYSFTGSKFGIYNKQNITDRKQLIITEGEFDSMIIYQCGYKNVVSVGTGVNALNEIFKQEQCFLNGFNSLIILGDNDETGTKMDKAFLEQYGYKVKLPNKSLYKDCSDMNEIFLRYGEEQIKKIINSAIVKIEGLRDLDAYPYEGVSVSEGKYIPTGLNTIDKAINDLAPGLVTLITGRSNGGKSTFVNQITANAIDKGNKVLLIAGEGLQEIIINNLYKAVLGKEESFYNYKTVNKRRFKEPKDKALEALKLWHKGKFKLFNKGESKLKTTDELLNLLSMEIKSNKHNLIVIDNLMSILSVEKANEKLNAQADFMQRLCDLSKTERIHIILVLHPNKEVRKGGSMDFEQISGTQDLANKADNIISVKRNYKDDDLLAGVDGEIEVLKNRYFPELPKVKTKYDEESGLLLEIEEVTGDTFAYAFKWQKYIEGTPEGFTQISI